MSTDDRRMGAREAKLAGRALRKEIPRSSHGDWTAVPSRRDPVELIEEQNADRLQ